MRERPAIQFAVSTLTPEIVAGSNVLEVGSLIVQETARARVEPHGPRKYIGVDIVEGPGVDVVCPVENLRNRFGEESFDVVFATEVMEHIRDWRTAVRNMTAVLRVGGLLLITTRSPGYPYHGSPHDYWRYDTADFSRIFAGWQLIALQDDPDRPGVFVAARKLTRETPDVDDIPLYSIATGRRVKDVSTARVIFHRISSPRRAAAWLTPEPFKPLLRSLARPFGYSTDYRGPSGKLES
jgi:SAM-dependent methyltransferase